MAADNCAPKLANTGKPGCITIADVTTFAYFDMAKDSAGLPKERPNTDLTTLAGVEAAINAADPRDRLYPIGKFENVDQVRSESVFWTANSGKKAKLRDGFKDFVGYIVNPPRELADKLNENGKQQFGWHFLDDSNHAVTKKGSTTSLCKPILIDNDTFDAVYLEKTDAAPAMLMIAFQWKSTEEDSDVKVLTGLDYTGSDINGLLDADAIFSNETINGFTATITTTCYGDAVEGMVLGDFSLEEITPTPGDVTGNIASVTESAPGVYDFVFTAPETLGDVLRLTGTYAGYDLSAMSDGTNDITI